jgi:mannose PTS system EIIA component
MAIVLVRIDDRLIHGQVIVGWGKVERPDYILVVSDQIAASEWETELCLAALPSEIKGRVVSEKEAPSEINRLKLDNKPSFVLFESPRSAYNVYKNGGKYTSINIGGMHSSKGKREILDYIYLDDEDTRYLKLMKNSGVKLDFRNLPDTENIDVMSMI